MSNEDYKKNIIELVMANDSNAVLRRIYLFILALGRGNH